jgi:hypothetical protein
MSCLQYLVEQTEDRRSAVRNSFVVGGSNLLAKTVDRDESANIERRLKSLHGMWRYELGRSRKVLGGRGVSRVCRSSVVVQSMLSYIDVEAS